MCTRSCKKVPVEGLVPGVEAHPEEGEEKLGAVDRSIAVLVELFHRRAKLSGAKLKPENLYIIQARTNK